MATTSPWPLIHTEREALVADLGTLTDEQWATPSLCDDWTVRDVLGHMISTAKMTPPKFFASLAAAGFRFNNMNAKGVAAEGPRSRPTAWQTCAATSRTPRTRRARWSRCSARR